MTDIDAVDDIIKHVDQLCGHRGDRQPEQESANGVFPEKIVISLHGCVPFVVWFDERPIRHTGVLCA